MACLIGIPVLTSCADAEALGAGDVYRVEIEACAGVSHQRATAMAVGPGLAATAGHSFESARGVVLRDVDGSEVPSEIVYLDLARDVALLSLDVDDHQIYSFAEAEDGAGVTIPTYASADGVVEKEATILRSVNATLDGDGRRRAVELSASIERGDSGAPVVDGDGSAVGMVFAAARRDDRGWAIAAAELDDALEAYASGTTGPPPDRCLSEPDS